MFCKKILGPVNTKAEKGVIFMSIFNKKQKKFLCVFLLCLSIPMNVMGSEPFFKYKGVINKKGTHA